jgi:transaldolase
VLALPRTTANPTILGHAMSSSDYDNSIRHLDEDGAVREELVFACALQHLRATADRFTPVWDTTGTIDGGVSLVPPELADNTVPTIMDWR